MPPSLLGVVYKDSVKDTVGEGETLAVVLEEGESKYELVEEVDCEGGTVPEKPPLPLPLGERPGDREGDTDGEGDREAAPLGEGTTLGVSPDVGVGGRGVGVPPPGVRVDDQVSRDEVETSGERDPVEDTEGEGVEDIVTGAVPD